MMPNEKNGMEQIKLYLLFGAIAFATAGMFGAARQVGVRFLEMFFNMGTIYYFLLLFTLFAPIFLITNLIKHRGLKNIKKIIVDSAIYSYITLGAMISMSNISYVFGVLGDLMLISLAILYTATILSIKIVETNK